MPFLLKDELKKHGGKYEKADQLFSVRVVISRNLVTGQNPPSAGVIRGSFVEEIQRREA
jgi:putative intracellular protease/amidase